MKEQSATFFFQPFSLRCYMDGMMVVQSEGKEDSEERLQEEPLLTTADFPLKKCKNIVSY